MSTFIELIFYEGNSDKTIKMPHNEEEIRSILKDAELIELISSSMDEFNKGLIRTSHGLAKLPSVKELDIYPNLKQPINL